METEGDEQGTAWRQCEALVEGSAWGRLGGSLQCARDGSPIPELAGACLCWQHEQKAERDGELLLTGGRTLAVERRWSEDGWRREVVGVAILGNVTHLDRWQSAPPQER